MSDYESELGLTIYTPKKFQASSIGIISQANEICADYEAQGFDLTLRQLYYQFVARGLLGNTHRNYKRLGSIINDARLAGLMPWEYIVDRTREVRSKPHFTSPGDVMRAAANSYNLDRWSGQGTRVEVWIEKDALVGVAQRVCNDLDLPLFSCRGYVSQSEMYSAAQRFIEHEDNEFFTTILHLGDHDPSGIDMTRDIQDRLDLFGAQTHVDRIALTMDQVDQFNPPPNPTKLTDSRATSYLEEYGDSSWELDALDPTTLDELIREHASHHITNQESWDSIESDELAGRRLIEKLGRDVQSGRITGDTND